MTDEAWNALKLAKGNDNEVIMEKCDKQRSIASKWPLRLAAVLLLSWSIIIGLSLLFNFRQINEMTVLLAQEQAKAAHDKDVSVIADAVSSRDIENKNIALERLKQENVNLSSTEMAIFELARSAEHPNFRQLATLIK